MKNYIVFILLICSTRIFAQKYGLGLLLADSLYANSPTAVPLMRGDYSDLPASASLKKFTPTPLSQGSDGTCAGWATAYEGRTILEAMDKEWNQNTIDSNTFSPSFVYNQIRKYPGCIYGTSLADALDVLKNEGDEKLKDFAYNCSLPVTSADKIKAAQYKIIEYREIAESTTEHKDLYIKKSIAEGRPVVIAFDCPYSFEDATNVWLPDSSDYKVWNRGHALTVIGYDDNKYKGAFELMNSWGTGWGNDGFIWIRYSDLDFFCKYAFEMINKSKANSNQPDLSGSLTFKLANGDLMKSKFNGEYFQMISSYPTGTLFQLHISNNEPAYVYAFSTDLTYKTYKIFPFTDRMVAYLPYRRNDVAIPDEGSYNMLDSTGGKSYYIFLYSKKSLNIDDIMNNFEKSSGNAWQRLENILNNDIVNERNIQFNTLYNLTFSAKSEDKSVVPILIEINHT
jgi:Papain family cysteine protease